jgi:NACHT domain
MRRRTPHLVLVGLVFVSGLLLGPLTDAVFNQAEPQPGWLQWIHDHALPIWILLVVMAVGATIILEFRRPTDRTDATSDLTLAQVADELAVAVNKQWQDEAQLRRLNDPYPLPVSWQPASPDLVEDWDALRVTANGWPGGSPTDPADWAPSTAELTGADNQLANRLARVPTGRLIVLGDPGAGKTMLLIRLVLDLLARRQPGDPVPVLVPLAGWNPIDQDVPTWLADRLIVDHPALAESAPPGASGVSRAQALWDQRLLLPILDGMDELPEGAWSRAVTRLNDALVPRQGLVLASRVAAYREAVTPADPAANVPVRVRVRAAAGISLRPLAPDDVRAYLRRDADSPAAIARWDPVLAALGTSDPLAQALTTPLMVGLARVIYNPRPGEQTGILPDPAELCQRTQLPTLAAIQEHLFDGFIPAAYRLHPDPASRCPWTAKQAERWLVFLAQHLERDRHGTTDLAWWELYRNHSSPVGLVVVLISDRGGLVVMPEGLEQAAQPQAVLARDRRTSWTLLPVFGVAVGLLGGLMFGLMGGGLLGGLALGLISGLIIGFVGGENPSWSTAYLPFSIARCWFALGRRLPWRLMSFLADAHQKTGCASPSGGGLPIPPHRSTEALGNTTWPIAYQASLADRATSVPHRKDPVPSGQPQQLALGR